MTAMTDPSRSPKPAGGVLRRLPRIGAAAVVVLAVEWRLLERAAEGPLARGLPWALIALMVPLALGVWAFEATSEGRPSFKADGPWAILLATIAAVVMLIVR